MQITLEYAKIYDMNLTGGIGAISTYISVNFNHIAARMGAV